MKILKNQSLKDFNTFHLDVISREMVVLEEEKDYQELFERYSFTDQKYLILGEGSNLLFSDHYNGLIITSELNGIGFFKEDEEYSWIKVDAGTNWHSFVQKTIKSGLQGLENLSLIPGKTGAAPIQNIGAYGVEIEQFVKEVEVFDLIEKKLVVFTHKSCEFSYRSSIFKRSFKNRFLVKSILFRLNKVPHYNISYEKIPETLDNMGIRELSPGVISQAVIAIRQEKLPDPRITGNAGSFFKNPVIDKIDYEGLKAEFPEIKGYEAGPGLIKIPAAWLIEACGWKGWREDDAGVYEKQPLVLVNYGKSTGKQLLSLAKKIEESVADRFGIILEPEVDIL